MSVFAAFSLYHPVYSFKFYAEVNIKITSAYIFRGDDMFGASKIKKTVPFFLSFCFISILLIFPSYCVEGVLKGLENTCRILIPSLFPYMVLSSFIMRSGADKYIGKILASVTKVLFNLPPVCSSAIILSLIGGFPVGAKCVQLLYSGKKITPEQAQRMMLFCVCSGPAFLITAIGTVMLHNIEAGIILYITQIFSCIIIGICTGIYSRIKNKNSGIKNTDENTVKIKSSSVTAILEASSDGAESVMSMTALVVIFSLLLNVYSKSGAADMLTSLFCAAGMQTSQSEIIIPIISEVTMACNEIRNLSLPVWYFSLATGFGGICVHMQIFGILRDVPIKRGIYILFRLINAVISTLAAYAVFKLYSPTTEVFSVLGGAEAETSATTLIGSAALIVMCAVFLLSLRKKELTRRFF